MHALELLPSQATSPTKQLHRQSFRCEPMMRLLSRMVRQQDKDSKDRSRLHR